MKYRSIVISGPVAAGSSTTAKAVAKKLDLKYYSAGDVFRQYVLDNNIPLARKDLIPDEFEFEVDNRLKKLAQQGEVVIDGHYTGYLTKSQPNTLKILLKCDENTRITRALLRKHTHTETKKDIIDREKGIVDKFHKIYNAAVDHLDPKFFDLVIDTTKTSTDEVVEKIVEKVKKSS